MTEYIRPFIIGSSWPVFVPFFMKVMNIDDKVKNYSYDKYTIIAPFYLGIMNVLSVYLSKQFNWDLKQRLLYIGLISGILACVIAKLSNSYNFTNKEWIIYFIKVMGKHIFAFSTIICFLENNM